MLRTAEAVSIGHPDKTADYISSYILDRLIEQDPQVRYAVEVMLKGNTVVLGGEITGHIDLGPLNEFVCDAIREVGYDERYARIWQDKAIDVRRIKIINLIGEQSPEINQGVQQNGWGDQGLFIGYACRGDDFINKELFLARKLNRALYDKARKSDNLGLDIKTQITLDDNDHITAAIVAIPMLNPEDLRMFVREVLADEPEQLIVNGTGMYQIHSSIADCGMTGRKLACDFYAGACPIGGGSPWTKDATKADLSLNLYARYLALENLKDNDECFVYLSSCIGRSDFPGGYIKTIKNGRVNQQDLRGFQEPRHLIRLFGLNRPIYTRLCRDGLIESIKH